MKFESDRKFKSIFTVFVIDREISSRQILLVKMEVYIHFLCKWGPSKLIIRKRIFPSGKPKEKIITKICKDPTWKLEEKYFRKISNKKLTNFYNDKLIKFFK